MAILGTDQYDPNNPNGSGAPSSGGSGAFLGGSGGGQGATTSVAKPTSSGAYTNLNQYLNANQGNAATTGQAVGNTLNQSATNATNLGSTYQSSAEGEIGAGGHNLGVNQDTLNAINAGTQNVDPNQMSKIQSGIAKVDPTLEAQIKAGKGPASVQTAYSGPGSIDASYKGPDAAKAENASYDGPYDTSSYKNAATGSAKSDALTAAQTAAGQAKAAGQGFTGVQSLLKGTYQQPQYSAGENSLDAFLVGGSQGAQSALQAGAANAGKAQGAYDQIDSLLSGKIKSAQDQATATNKTYGDAINAGMATSQATQKAYADAIAKANADTTAKSAYDSDYALAAQNKAAGAAQQKAAQAAAFDSAVKAGVTAQTKPIAVLPAATTNFTSPAQRGVAAQTKPIATVKLPATPMTIPGLGGGFGGSAMGRVTTSAPAAKPAPTNPYDQILNALKTNKGSNF